MASITTRVLILALLIGGLLNARANAPSGWYSSLTVKYIYAGSTGNRVAFAVTAPITAGTCGSTGGNVELTLDPNNPYFCQMYNLVTQAYARSVPISVYTDGTCGPYGVMATDLYLGVQ